jgi:hypothetical protein
VAQFFALVVSYSVLAACLILFFASAFELGYDNTPRWENVCSRGGVLKDTHGILNVKKCWPGPNDTFAEYTPEAVPVTTPVVPILFGAPRIGLTLSIFLVPITMWLTRYIYIGFMEALETHYYAHRRLIAKAETPQDPHPDLGEEVVQLRQHLENKMRRVSIATDASEVTEAA